MFKKIKKDDENEKDYCIAFSCCFLFSFTACGNGGDSDTSGKKDNGVTYKFGDTITTKDNMFEFTPVFEGYAQTLANWPDEGYLTPEGLISGKTPYDADEEKIMMYFSGKINYIGEAKENKTFRYDFTIDYDNGYIFEFVGGDAFNSGKGYSSGCGVTTNDSFEKWEYKNYATFEPLSSNRTRNVRFCIEVPNQLQANPEKIVFNFKINGDSYKLVMA